MHESYNKFLPENLEAGDIIYCFDLEYKELYDILIVMPKQKTVENYKLYSSKSNKAIFWPLGEMNNSFQIIRSGENV